MTHSRRAHPGGPVATGAVVPTVGLAGVGPARTDVTATCAFGTIKDAAGGGRPGLTIAVISLQRSLGGA